MSAGTLENPTTATPTYAPTSMPVPTTMASIDLDLHPSTTAPGAYRRRTLEVYRDHLERDFQNFGTGIVSKPAPWTFLRYGITTTMPSEWNCHGSTRHLYDGTGSGSAGDVSFVTGAWTVKTTVVVTHYPNGGGTHPPLGTLNRGDVVVYTNPKVFGGLMHSQTCTGNGTETYGANNEVLAHPGSPSEQTWKWATSPAGDWANNCWIPGVIDNTYPVTITVYGKP